MTVNDAVIRLGVIEGDFHWHKHDDQDEFFLVVEGQLLIDLQADARTVTLGPHQGFSVPRGVVHRTRAPSRMVIVMVEAAGDVPTGAGRDDIAELRDYDPVASPQLLRQASLNSASLTVACALA